jgi:amidase
MGPLARTAEDAALMLDAITGFDPLWPISVPPTWTSAVAEVQSIEDLEGVRIGYVADLAGIGVEEEVDRVCRAAARSLQLAGAAVDEIECDVSEGREAYQALRGEWMVGQQLERIEMLDHFGANLRGNVREGLKLTVRDTAKAQHIREAVLEKFRALFKKYAFLLTPAAPVLPFPVNINFPDMIAGKRLTSYVDWIAPAYLITLVGFPAGSVPAGKASNGLPVGLQIVAPRLSEPRILGLAS